MRFTFPDRLPIIPVRVGVSAAREEWLAGKLEPAPRKITVNALVDTGATISIVDTEVIAKLRISPRGDCRISGFCSPAQVCGNYDIGLEMDADGKSFRIPDLQAAGAGLQDRRYAMLLGADVLEHFELTVNFREGFIELTPLT